MLWAFSKLRREQNLSYERTAPLKAVAFFAEDEVTRELGVNLYALKPQYLSDPDKYESLFGSDFAWKWSETDWDCKADPLESRFLADKAQLIRLQGTDHLTIARSLDFETVGDLDFRIITSYDQARCRGTDMPHPKTGRGLLTVDADTAATDLYQAMKRMRGFTHDHPAYPQVLGAPGNESDTTAFHVPHDALGTTAPEASSGDHVPHPLWGHSGLVLF